MTHFKRIIAVLLALVMVLGLTACGRFETDMAKAAKDMKNLESLRVDIDSDIILGMAVLGENKNFDLDLNGTAEVRRHPLTGKAALRMNMLGDAQEFPVYFQKKDNQMTVYTRDILTGTWSKMTNKLDKNAVKDDIKLTPGVLLWLAKFATSFSEQGTETVRGSETTVYTGTIKAQDVKDALEKTNVLDTLFEATGIRLSAADFANIGDVPVTLNIDRTSGMLVKVSADLTAVVQPLLPQFVGKAIDNSVLGIINFSKLGMEVSVSKAVVSAVLYDFNAVGEITIPAEALAAS